jgi:hypothetical protein
MYLFLSTLPVFVFALYLFFSLKRELNNKYTWTREIEYKDYINLKKIAVLKPTESLSVEYLSKEQDNKELLTDIEYMISEGNNYNIPFKTVILSYIAAFYDERNIFSSLVSFKETDLILFSGINKLDSPSFFIEKNIYNIFIKYEIFKGQDTQPLIIKTKQDYDNFLNELYKFSDDFTCKIVYTVYRQVGKDERGAITFDLSLNLKIGPSFANVKYSKPYIKEIIYVDSF